MGRAILAVVAGYLAMALIVLASSAGAIAVLGVEGSFEVGTYDPSKPVIVVSIVSAVVAALVGGLVAGKIARSATPIKVLIGIVLVLGLGTAGVQMRKAGGVARPAGQSVEEMVKGVQEHGRTPPWLAFTQAIIGGVGVAVGAGKRLRG